MIHKHNQSLHFSSNFCEQLHCIVTNSKHDVQKGLNPIEALKIFLGLKFAFA